MDMRPVCPLLPMSNPLQKAFSFRGLCLPDLLTRGSAPGSAGGSAPDPVIRSRSALAMVRAPPLFYPSLRLCLVVLKCNALNHKWHWTVNCSMLFVCTIMCLHLFVESNFESQARYTISVMGVPSLLSHLLPREVHAPTRTSEVHANPTILKIFFEISN